jgi:ADP-ribose pyrophosphatase YjhB (NUDIX family)
MKVVQKCLIKKGTKFLFIKRSEKARSFPGYWDLPGGNWELNENFEAALAREVREETHLKVKNPKVFNVLAKPDWMMVGYFTKQASGKFKLSKEHSGFVWQTKKEAKKLKIQPPVKKLLAKIL